MCCIIYDFFIQISLLHITFLSLSCTLMIYSWAARNLVLYRCILSTVQLFVADDDTKMVIDCDSRSREEIHNHIKQIVGRTE